MLSDLGPGRIGTTLQKQFSGGQDREKAERDAAAKKRDAERKAAAKKRDGKRESKGFFGWLKSKAWTVTTSAPGATP